MVGCGTKGASRDEREREREREQRWSRRGGHIVRSALQGSEWCQGSGIGRNNDEHIDCSCPVDDELETEPGPSWHHLTTMKRLKDEIEPV